MHTSIKVSQFFKKTDHLNGQNAYMWDSLFPSKIKRYVLFLHVFTPDFLNYVNDKMMNSVTQSTTGNIVW